MKKILFGIIIVLIIFMVYINPKVTNEGFENIFSNLTNKNAIFPGMTLEDIALSNPINYSYSYEWVDKLKTQATLEHELDYNSDVKFMSNFSHLDEIKGLKTPLIEYKPMDASKLYEKKISSI